VTRGHGNSVTENPRAETITDFKYNLKNIFQRRLHRASSAALGRVHSVYNMGSYTSEYPSTQIDPLYRRFFEEFYKISDTPDAHEKYADQFTKDAKLIMASKTANGRSGMRAC